MRTSGNVTRRTPATVAGRAIGRLPQRRVGPPQGAEHGEVDERVRHRRQHDPRPEPSGEVRAPADPAPRGDVRRDRQRQREGDAPERASREVGAGDEPRPADAEHERCCGDRGRQAERAQQQLERALPEQGRLDRLPPALGRPDHEVHDGQHDGHGCPHRLPRRGDVGRSPLGARRDHVPVAGAAVTIVS